MPQPLNFQQAILKLHQFWADYDCVIWEPYNVQNGAGTGNPATLLRVLGPEPWRVAYVEPCIRPDDQNPLGVLKRFRDGQKFLVAEKQPKEPQP